MDGLRAALAQGLETIRTDNSRKLDEIRGTVDEKLQTTLQKRISDSFRAVSQQLEQVYKGLGEMQTLAADVGGLKRVLSGVKTRGILGEVQLGGILREILAPGQYAENVATIPGSANRVEYAVRLPGQNGTVWLPIDAKFPADSYTRLLDARDSGDPAAVAAARKQLEQRLRQEAKDIREKYIELPYTTAFGVLFLPFEGLYAEVVSSGVSETLQRDFQISIAGPSTMAALLNALQMGFRTLAIQKRSGEVWQVLAAVKTEFEKFGARAAVDAAPPQPDRQRPRGIDRHAQPCDHPPPRSRAAARPRRSRPACLGRTISWPPPPPACAAATNPGTDTKRVHPLLYIFEPPAGRRSTISKL